MCATFASQERLTQNNIDLQLENASLLEANASLALIAFESAIRLTFAGQSEGGDILQFVGNCCYLIQSERRLTQSDFDQQLTSIPQAKVALGRYHLAGQAKCALDLARSYARSICAEIHVARLEAFPRTNLAAKTIKNLGNWQIEFAQQLSERRPELFGWPNWELHQWRDTVVQQVKEEFELAEGRVTPAKIRSDDWLQTRLAEIRALPCEAAITFLRSCLVGFARRWAKGVPDEQTLLVSVEGAMLVGAEGHFYQEFEQLTAAFSRVASLCILDSILEQARYAVGHLDIAFLCDQKYAILAALDKLKVKTSQLQVANSKSNRTYDFHERVSQILRTLKEHADAKPGVERTRARNKKNRQMADWPEAKEEALRRWKEHERNCN